MVSIFSGTAKSISIPRCIWRKVCLPSHTPFNCSLAGYSDGGRAFSPAVIESYHNRKMDSENLLFVFGLCCFLLLTP